MGKTILFGVLWSVVICFVISFSIGVVVGYSAASHYLNNPEAGIEVAKMAGYRVVRDYGLLVFAGAVLLSAFGSVAGILPGTKRRAAPDSFEEWDAKQQRV
jgi:hypothetical protein